MVAIVDKNLDFPAFAFAWTDPELKGKSETRFFAIRKTNKLEPLAQLPPLVPQEAPICYSGDGAGAACMALTLPGSTKGRYVVVSRSDEKSGEAMGVVAPENYHSQPL